MSRIRRLRKKCSPFSLSARIQCCRRSLSGRSACVSTDVNQNSRLRRLLLQNATNELLLLQREMIVVQCRQVSPQRSRQTNKDIGALLVCIEKAVVVPVDKCESVGCAFSNCTDSQENVPLEIAISIQVTTDLLGNDGIVGVIGEGAS